MKEYKHFLITRFNIVQKWYGTADRNGQPTQTDEWLEERIRLFNTYCFPSVKNQSCRDFVWFVLFNSETPEYFKQKINQYQEAFLPFTPLYLEPYGDEDALINKKICEQKDSYVITTRLDSDDAIHRDFIKKVQDNFDKQNDVFLNFVNGYQYDEKKKNLYLCFYKNNHYISRIEKNLLQPKNVFGDHRKIQESAQVKDIKTKPLWIEIIHDRNVGNDLFWKNEPIKINAINRVFRHNLKYYYLLRVKNVLIKLKRYLKKISK